MVNLAAYDALPSDLQEIVKHASVAANSYSLAEFTNANAASQRILVDEHDVEVRHFPEDVIREMFKVSLDVVAETASEGDVNRRIYDSWSKFRADVMARGPFAEQGFMNDRALV